ncbi:MAG: flavodoxin family protein, partial [Dehalococcoidales bacterium]|nr:flavodoxin family protein [Dehalococcoidales bacterium]
MMKVVAIIGSPRKNGNTEQLAAHTLKAVAEEGIETEIVPLAGKDIRPCNACMACTDSGECSINDDLPPVYRKMEEADGIILD